MKEALARTRRRTVLGAVMVVGSAGMIFAGCTRIPGGGGGGVTPTWQPPTTMDPGMDHGGGGGGDGHNHGGSARLNHPPTERQKQWSRELVAHTKWALQRIPNKAAALALGYNDIGDGQHFTHPKYRIDGREFDVNRIESLVFNRVTGQVQAAMYNMEPSTTVDNVYDYAGNWIIWHGHDTLCWQAPENQVNSPGWTRLGGVVINGRCTSGYKHTPVPMVHVWVTDTTYENRCGAFASIDGVGEGSCIPEFQQNPIAASAPPANWPWKP